MTDRHVMNVKLCLCQYSFILKLFSSESIPSTRSWRELCVKCLEGMDNALIHRIDERGGVSGENPVNRQPVFAPIFEGLCKLSLGFIMKPTRLLHIISITLCPSVP